MTSTETQTVAERETLSIVEECLGEVRHIATLPTVAEKLMRLEKDEHATVRDVLQVITSDPALCTRILKVVNSSFYGLPAQIASIDRAVLLLGFKAVKNIAVAASLHKLFRTAKTGSYAVAGDLWVHSIAVATGARMLAEKTGRVLADEAFLAGMIHDIGITIEIQTRPQKFTELTELLSREQSLTFRQLEQQVLGATHESFGAALCRNWNFPVQFMYVAGCHHEPMQLSARDCVLPAIVHVADILAAGTGMGYTRTVEADTVDQQILIALDLSEDDIKALAETLPDAIQETQQVFSE